MMPGAGPVAKATLLAFDHMTPLGSLTFNYNPTQISTSKAASWRRPTTRAASSAADPEFTGSQPQTVDMELFFDAWNDPAGDVSTSVNKLLGWTRPTDASRQRQLPRPPAVEFQWGVSRALQGFRGYLKSVAAQYTMFRADGVPIRATCKVTIEEIPTEPSAQNPTSGARESRRSVVIDDGDSLAAVAYRQYGQAPLWRALAAFNGIDDPLAVAPGTRLLVPSLAEARRLAAVPEA
ncbi:MAG: LysM peptidoglycan-binding domain-containing protein [Chloroflexi bacterium]|nr:LysM peptidoglycan-binding domain-containing protein [Chloroflexota bacterium]